MTKQDIQNDLKESMLAKDELKTSVLRMLVSAIGYFEIEKGAGYQATEEDVATVVGREIKKRKESIEMYKQGGRQELADKEQKELEILQAFLPEQMGEDEVRNLVNQAISQTGASSMQDMGKVMGVLMPQVKGRADGSLVSNIVKEELSH